MTIVLSREDVTSLTIVMGITYISYSSLFVTANIKHIDLFTDMWMNFYHLAIMFYSIKCCLHTKYKILA